MPGIRNRAAVVSLHGDRLLVIRRNKAGRRYAVLPGGGVEAQESAPAAAIRELREETGLDGEVLRHLWTVEHADRTADYFLVAVPLARMVVSGPESERQSSDDSYLPGWIPVADLEAENLQPATVRLLIRALLNGEP